MPLPTHVASQPVRHRCVVSQSHLTDLVVREPRLRHNGVDATTPTLDSRCECSSGWPSADEPGAQERDLGLVGDNLAVFSSATMHGTAALVGLC